MMITIHFYISDQNAFCLILFYHAELGEEGVYPLYPPPWGSPMPTHTEIKTKKPQIVKKNL